MIVSCLRSHSNRDRTPMFRRFGLEFLGLDIDQHIRRGPKLRRVTKFTSPHAMDGVRYIHTPISARFPPEPL